MLVRGRSAYPRLVEQFATFDIPFSRKVGQAFSSSPRLSCSAGLSPGWPTSSGGTATGRDIPRAGSLRDYGGVFELPRSRGDASTALLREWKEAVPRENRTADLIGELYELLDELDVRGWDLSDPLVLNRLGTLARFSSLLADYESVGGGRGRTRTFPASRWAGRTAAPGTTATSRSTSSTTRREPTRASMARLTTCWTRSTSRRCTEPRASSGRRCSSPR